MSVSTTSSLHFLSLTTKTPLSKPSFSPSNSLAFYPTLFNASLSLSSSPTKFFRHSKLKVALSSDFEVDDDVAATLSSDFDDDDEEEKEVNFSPDLKLFVGNLPFSCDSTVLAGLFGQAGTVEMVEVIYDKDSGRSRGFGFVTMSTVDEVEAAAQQFNGYELEGRALRVNFGPPPPREDNFSRAPRDGGRRSFGDNGGGRSYGDNGGGRSYGDNGGGRSYGDNGGGRSYGDNGGGRSYGDNGGGRRSYGDNSGGRSYGDNGGGRRSYGDNNGGGRSFDNTNRLYVGNLSWGVDNMALENMFSEQGKVVEAKVVYDRESGRSRGFGFVTYGSSNEVNRAIENLNGADLDGRQIRVSVAEAPQTRRQF